MKKLTYLTPDNKVRWHSEVAAQRTWRIGRFHATFRMTKGNGVMGRLGGGWAWKLGIMGARRELCMELLFFTLRFHFKKPSQK